MTTDNLKRDVLSQESKHSFSGVSFNDLYTLLISILNSRSNEAEKDEVKNELKKIKKDIDAIKSELTANEGGTSTFNILPLSIKDLDEIYATTEEATNGILDEAELIQNMVGDHPRRDELNEAIGRLCEKCNFQDLTGQRINRVIKNLGIFEHTTLSLIKIMLGSEFLKRRDGQKLEYANDSLMNGPQMNNFAPSQEDIDKLFD
jgi:chemotaxis protein CheZ